MQEVPINNASTKTWSRWTGLLLILLIGIISVVEFSSFLTSPSFSSEFPQFFTFTHGKTFSGLVALYRLFHLPWYRPTQFFLPYWIGDHFLSWHDPNAWRFCELLTMLMVCALIYGLVSQLLPGRRLAAFFAALYFTCVPTVYVPLYELFAFDFLHIVFTLLCVVAFIAGYRKDGFRGAALTGLAWLAYVIALTSKEITIVAPLYLLLVSFILLAMEPRAGTWRDRLMREALRLTPFWIMPAVYWAVHIRRIPKAAFNNAGDYRTGLNWSMIGRNAEKYPSWMARIYQHTLDNLAQAGGYATWRNELIGITLLVIVIVAAIRLWRADPVYRKYILLAVAWIVVFLLIPIYSGGYFWHGNLALCGYCMLVGAAIDWVVARIPARRAQVAFIVALVVGTVAVTRADAVECLAVGIHSETYRINSSILAAPPVPFDQVSGKALVYIEDTQRGGDWSYGAGLLFNLVYLDLDLEQKVVPAVKDVSLPDQARWLHHPNAFFFRYDDHYRWHDATAEFRQFASMHAAEFPPPPVISAIGPPGTRVGTAFNTLADGSSALAINGENFQVGAQILMNGRKVPTAYANPAWVTATVPPDVYATPGNVAVQVLNADGQTSNAAGFLVTK